MARLKEIGFELNSAVTGMEGANVTSSPTISTAQAYTGLRSMALSTTLATGILPDLGLADSSNVLYVGFAYYMDTIPGIAFNPLQIRTLAGIIVSRLTIAATTGIVTTRDSSNAVVATGPALQAGRWYWLEFKHDASTTPGTIEAKVDGVSIGSGPNNIQGLWGQARVGCASSSITSQLYLDNVIINDSTGPLENTWVGNQKLIFVQANAAGDFNQWNNTANAAGDANNYQLVDEKPPDDVTTMVQTGTLNQIDMYNFEDSSIPVGSTITCVTVNGRARNNVADATTAAKFRIIKASGGTVLESSSYKPNNITWLTNGGASTVYQPPFITAYQDPDGINWTPATINTMQAGIKLTAANVNRIQLSTMWVYISYIPRVDTRPTITLDGLNIRTPNKLTDVTANMYAEQRPLTGSVNRKYYGDTKRAWELEYKNLNQTDYKILRTIYRSYLSAGQTKSLAITGTAYFNAISTTVHIDMRQVDFPRSGTFYLTNFTLTLKEA